MPSTAHAIRSVAFSVAAVAAITAAAMVGLLMVQLACTLDDESMARKSEDSPAAHGVHSEELQQAMRDLNRRSKEEIAAELYTGSPVRPSMEGVIESAGAIARSAEGIPNILVGLDMPAGERREFLTLTDRLAAQARELQAQARGNNVEATRAAMSRMNSTCDACHGRFRLSAP